MTRFNDLDTHVLPRIFEHLEPREAAQCSSVCKAWHGALQAEELWQEACDHDLGLSGMQGAQPCSMPACSLCRGAFLGYNPSTDLPWPQTVGLRRILTMGVQNTCTVLQGRMARRKERGGRRMQRGRQLWRHLTRRRCLLLASGTTSRPGLRHTCLSFYSLSGPASVKRRGSTPADPSCPP